MFGNKRGVETRHASSLHALAAKRKIGMLDLKNYKYKDFDWALVGSAGCIFILGLLFLFSATYLNNIDFMLRQITWFLIGCLIFMFMVNINYRKIVGVSYIFYFLIVGLLILVLMIGRRASGAQRWLEIGFLNLQPSEFAKIFITLALVQYLASHRPRGTMRDMIAPFLIIAAPFILILEQPDLGTAIMFVPVFFILLYVWGMKLRYLFLIILIGALSSPAMWFLLKDYQRDRISVFMNPNIDPLGAGYTVIQSKIAVGSGGILGKGWLSGTQNQLNFLTERHTDFIFSVVGEEWGFVGSMILIGLFYVLVKRAFEIAEKTDDPYGVLTTVGLTAMIGIQVVVNISMTMGFMPVVGLPLPLVSYGGSSFLVTMMALGILESIAIHR